MGDAPHPGTMGARIARVGLRGLGGWRYVGPLPEPDKAVCLAVPHTSNLDGLLLVLLAQSVGLTISWMVKDSWGRGPVGSVVRGVGGVPIDRSRAHGMVDQMVAEFERRDRLLLVIPPEGTRSRADAWKSGFYRIAIGAGVPLVPGFLDYRTREGSFGPPIDLTGDATTDMGRLRGVYRDGAAMARYPDNFGPVRLRDED
jgi:1-acyl-sn-glycerol-3-phosphate acyltransferase